MDFVVSCSEEADRHFRYKETVVKAGLLAMSAHSLDREDGYVTFATCLP